MIAPPPRIVVPRPAPVARELEFNDADFGRVRRLIRAYAGIALADSKLDMVYSRLARRLRALGLHRFGDYLGTVESDAREREQFINALTTNLTSFFREAHHFTALAAQMKAVGQRRTFQIWCGAASTGEEPWSLAMTAVETFANWNPPVAIFASDIDTGALDAARAGVYGPAQVERVGRERLARFFEPQGAGGHYRVRPELARLLRFARVNLLDATWPALSGLDAIFCRNVMIYFDKDTQHRVLQRFVCVLRPDGRLYAGHSESFAHAQDLFRSVGQTIYVPVTSATR